MTDDQIAALEAALAAKLNQIAGLQDEATEMATRLNEARAERDRDPATVHELQPR